MPRTKPLTCSENSRITMITTMDLMACRAKAGTPMAYIDWVTACITKAPMRLDSKEKRPPDMDVPPITTARIASSSAERPMLLASEVLTFEQATNCLLYTSPSPRD